ncbi:nose resistant to fluoxetine protein 6-like [Diadema antillarum]|uniref:nose resistant to fluoxetine protein 6-like n=1 Tax=Diadema antillarum TaxID=105358 RepID=UPI003A88A73A
MDLSTQTLKYNMTSAQPEKHGIWVSLLVLLVVAMMVPCSQAITPDVIRQVVAQGQVQTAAKSLNNVSKACSDAVDYLLFHSPATLKEYVFDSYGKPQAGFLEMNWRWLGHYDECQGIPSYRYCATIFTGDLSALSSPVNLTLTLGVCVPEQCSQSDVQTYLNTLLDGAGIPVKPLGNESAVICTEKSHKPFSAGFIGTIFLFSFIFALMLLGALYDLVVRYNKKKSTMPLVSTNVTSINRERNGVADAPLDDREPESSADNANLIPALIQPKPAKWEQFLLGFAFNRNLAKLMSTKGSDRSIACLNGIRVLSMAWVILGHTFFFAMEMGITGNLLIAYGWYQNFGFQVISNAFFSVDSFFFLSGFLLTFITLRKMSERDGRIPWGFFYFHRYWRLTPAVLTTILIWMYIKPYMGDAPLWNMYQNVDSCVKYWWTNILYINNFYPRMFMNECIGWVWYLANDMQFFVISPLIILPLYYFPPLGLSLIGFLLFASFGVTGALTGIYKFPAGGTQIPGYDKPTMDFSSVIYSKPYCRIPPYLVGMLLGFLMYRQGDRKIRLKPVLVALGWTVATAVGMSCVYGLFHAKVTLAGSVLYQMLSRFAWAVALSWVVFACKEGYGGWVNDILSWSAWLPLSRVTYSAYLLHPIVIYIFYGNLKTSFMASLWIMPTYFVGFFALAYAAAVVMALFIEFPFANMEKLFMPSR